MGLTYDERREQAREALRNPRVGDRFHEMYSFWICVVERQGDRVTTMQASAPCTFPEDAEVRFWSVEEFGTYFGVDRPTGPTLLLADRGNQVEGWIETRLALKKERENR